LKQPQFSPVPIEEQVAAIFAGTNGFLDRVPIDAIGRFESSMLNELRSTKPELLEAIRTEREISEATDKGLREFLTGFATTFA
jgi:F-type H+-transporting ATPase subunit alpha